MATPDGNNTTVIDTQQEADPLAGVKTVADELKQNIGDLASAVCELEGVIKSELLNDIGIAVQEIKQFNISITRADGDFEKFLKKLEEFKLHPVNVQTPAPQIYIINGGGEGAESGNGAANGKDKQENPLEKAEEIREILDYTHQVYENRDLIKKLFEKAKGINNPGENLFEGETGLGNYEFPEEIEFPQQLYEVPKSGYWGTNAIDAEEEFNQQALFNTSENLGYDATSDIAANTGRTLLTDATVESTEVGAALLGDAEVGAIFGPEGALAALIIGGIYELGKALFSADDVNPYQLVDKNGTPLLTPPQNTNVQPQGMYNPHSVRSDVMGYSDDGGVTMQIIHRNDMVNSGIVWGENTNYGASNSGASTNAYTSTNTNTSTNNPPAKAAKPGSGGIITTIPGQGSAGGYSASGGEQIDWEHPVLPQIYINPDLKPPKPAAKPNSSYAPDAAFVQRPFQMQMLSQFSNSIRHINQQSKCVTINVNIRTNADIHNNTIHCSSFTDKDIQNKIMEVLMAAISDSKVSAATH